MNIIGLNKAFEDSRFKTQKDLAKACGWSSPKMTRIINGDQDISIKDLIKLCEVLDVSADYLLGLKPSVNNTFTDEELFYLKTIVQYDIVDPGCDGSNDIRWSTYDKLIGR